MLNRSIATSTLRTWGLELKERLGFKRAAVALARKPANCSTLKPDYPPQLDFT